MTTAAVPPLPALLAPNFDGMPEYLRQRSQWVLWKREVRAGKPTKVPYTVTGQRAKSNDPRTWSTFDEVRRAYKRRSFHGVGFCLSESDGLTGIDLDHVLDRDTGEVIIPEAREILAHFSNDYAERSPSGDGLRLFVIGHPGRSGKAKGRPWIEVYAHPSNRYLTVTGHQFSFGRPA